MKRIIKEEISEAKRGHMAVIQSHPSVYPQDIAVAQAQLEADKKDMQKLFKKIDGYAKFVHQIEDDTFLVYSVWELKAWWQTLKDTSLK